MIPNHRFTIFPIIHKLIALPCLFVVAVSLSPFAAQVNIKHTMLISGTSLDYVGIVDTSGKVVWKHDEIESAAGNGQKNDSWLLQNGRVAYSYQWGVRIVDVRTNKVIWDRPTPKRNNQSGETHSCQPLDGGSRFLIPECFADTAFIVEVDTAKKEFRRIALTNQGDGTHGKWRQIRKTAQNTYLVSSYGLHHSYEYDTTGHLLHDFPAGGYVANRLDNGNTIIGTGDDCRIVEFNSSGTQVWEVNNTTDTVKGMGIGFASEPQRLPNGNTIVTNWGGHGTGFGAAVVEIRPDRTVVGAIPDSFKNTIASVKVIDGWTFPARQFAITASAGQNGTISPCGTVPVDSAASKTFTFTPQTGYAVDSVKVDGVDVGAVNTYTFTSVKAIHTINVTFRTAVGVMGYGLKSTVATVPVVAEHRGIVTCAISFTGVTQIQVFDCYGRTVGMQTVNGPGYYTFGKKLAFGLYTVTLKNVRNNITSIGSVMIKGKR